MLKRLNTSIQYKIALMLLFSVAASSTIIFFYGLSQNQKALHSKAEELHSAIVASESRYIEAKSLGVVPEDLKVLTESPSLKGVLRAVDNDGMDPEDGSTTEDWEERLSLVCQSFMRSRPDYQSIRLILKDGRESVHVSLNPQADSEEKIVSIEEDQRVNQLEKPYFQSTLRTPENDYYVSDLGLESGNKPIIKYAMPIYQEKVIKGAFVIDLLAQSILSGIKIVDDQESGQENYLINKDGYYLAHSSDSKKEWGLEKGHGANFKKDFSEIAATILSGQSGSLISQGRFFSYGPVYPKNGHQKNFWVQIRSLPEQIVLAEANEFKKISTLILAACLVVFVVLGSLITKIFVVKPLSHLMDRIVYISENGDLTEEIKVKSQDEIGSLSSRFNDFIEKFREIIKNVSLNTDKLTSSSQGLTTTASQMKTGASDMSSSAESVASSTEKMSASLSEVAKSTSEASSIAGQANQQSQEAAEIIGKLNTSANQIGKVVDTIKDIADQTNLLALNATIEAASAGDAGKGFAVVANEVKELARQTALATEEIAKQVDEIQGNTSGAVESINQISEIISRLNNITQTTASAVREQSETTNEVASNVSRTAQLAGETATGAEQTNVSANDLSNMAAQLKDLMRQFKVS